MDTDTTSDVIWERSTPVLSMGVVFKKYNNLDVLSLSFWGGKKDGISYAISRDQARDLASRLLEWADSDDVHPVEGEG